MKLLSLWLLFICFGQTTEAQPQMLTARQYFSDVLADVQRNHGLNVQLVWLNTQGTYGTERLQVDALSGTAEMWLYTFYSKDDNMMVIGKASDNPISGTEFAEIYADEWDAMLDTTRIAGGWIDSPIAATVWRNSGLQSFFNAHSNARTISMFIGKSMGVSWGVDVHDGEDTVACFVDAYTAELKKCYGVNEIYTLDTPIRFEIASLYPNPVKRGIDVRMQIAGSNDDIVSIYIYSALGDLQGVVENMEMRQGAVFVTLSAEYFDRAGISFVKVISKNGMKIGKLIVLPE